MLYVFYIYKKLVGLSLIFLYTHSSSIFDKVKYFDYLNKNRSINSSLPTIIYKWICPPTRDKLSRWCVTITKKIWIDIFVNNLLGHTHRCFNHSPYLVDVQGVHFGKYGFRPIVRVSTHDYLWIGQEKYYSQWCMVYSHS